MAVMENFNIIHEISAFRCFVICQTSANNYIVYEIEATEDGRARYAWTKVKKNWKKSD